jgi:hypothetical protein
VRPNESYLTGTPLQDSRYFALVRTWPAPEMSRPGCVWSHVLILTPELLASRRDLGGLNVLFARPRARNATRFYTRPIYLSETTTGLYLSETTTGLDAEPSVVAHVLSSYYAGRPFPASVPSGSELDSAILAVWSQQWPRLRTAFSFRTARTTAATGRGNARFDFQPSSDPDPAPGSPAGGISDGSDVEWVDAAVDDAISQDVTPLRRFLWRYGKDVRSPRRSFQNLVKIHLATRALDSLPLWWAESIANLFPRANNAATLKRDMLGIELAPLALCPAVAPEDTLELLAILCADSTVVSNQSLEAKLSQAPADVVPALASSLAKHEAELAEYVDVVMRIMPRIADNRTVTDTRVPPAVRLSILKSRHDLIDSASLAAIGDEDLLRLFDDVGEDSRRGKIVAALLQRDVAAYPDGLIRQHAGELLVRAIVVRSEGALSLSGEAVFRGRARELISSGALDPIAGSAMAAQAADLLHYPIDDELANDVPRWLSALERAGPEAEGQLRTNFEAYMCVVAIKSRTPSAWDLLPRALPRLRSVVLAGGLVNPAYKLLDAQLPPHGWNSWDFNRRLLIGLRDLRRRTGVDSAVVAQLALSDDDLEFVLDYRRSKRDKGGGSIFWPWS